MDPASEGSGGRAAAVLIQFGIGGRISHLRGRIPSTLSRKSPRTLRRKRKGARSTSQIRGLDCAKTQRTFTRRDYQIYFRYRIFRKKMVEFCCAKGLTGRNIEDIVLIMKTRDDRERLEYLIRKKRSRCRGR
jgi:hypothetical protein